MRCEACGRKGQLREVGHPTTGDAEVNEEGKIMYAKVCVDATSCQRITVAQKRVKNGR